MSQKVDFGVHRKKHEKGVLFTSFHAFFIISPLFQKVCFLKQRVYAASQRYLRCHMIF